MPESVIATTPAGMVAAQARTIEWVGRKISEARAELGEARQTFDALQAAQQKTAPATGLIRKASRRLAFYEKVRAALEAGYYIIPPFPVQVFAVRTDRDTPPDVQRSGRTGKIEQTALLPVLPVGEGQYVDPEPRRLHVDTLAVTHKRHDGTPYSVDEKFFENDDWRDVVFPVRACKPEIVEAAAGALALKIFDALGIAPAYRAADPMIVGHIRNPNAPRYQTPLTFFVAWWLDERDL